MWSIIFPARGSVATQVNKIYLVWTFSVCFVNEIDLYLSLKMYVTVSLSCSVRWATVKLLVLWIVYVRVPLFWGPADCVSTCMKRFPRIMLSVLWKVIALSPHRIKDKFHLYFQSFHKLPLLLHDSGNFVKTLKICVNIFPSRPHAITNTKEYPSEDAFSRCSISPPPR